MPNQAYTQDTGPEGLPRGAELIRYGSIYKVIWDLGDGMGYAWYDISPEHLKNLYGTNTPPAAATYENWADFNQHYRNPTFWGNIAEVSLKAETPWQDLKERIFNQFGFVPGLDSNEVRRLLMQAFFEGWSENQWVVEYRKTGYFNNLTDAQRQWVGQSQAEKNEQINTTAFDMVNQWRTIMGTEINSQDPALYASAVKIASGQMTMDEWLYLTRQKAAEVEGSPVWREIRAEEEAALAEGNQIENLSLFAEQQWQSWVGPVAMPSNFSTTWGSRLASGQASEADLENYLKEISQSRWAYKPPTLTWEDWSASYKSQIRDELELLSIHDNDPLLGQLLNSDLTGQDVTQMIRQDQRFLSTQKMYGQLSSAAADIGRRFGFIT